MNLWLSPHGIWYYRKVTTLPCGRRKEFRKSLQTRDKRVARAAVEKLLSCVRSRPIPIPSPVEVAETPLQPSGIKPATRAAKPVASLLSVLSDRYLKEKALSWAQEGVINHFAGLKLQRAKEVSSRSGYTAEERRKFIGWAKQQEPHRRWITLLGLFTGARANEICQLYADDVQQVDGIWCLDIRSGRPDQKLKTANSARLVPLHRHLLERGFIEFVKGRAGGCLFPELPHRQDGYSHLWGQPSKIMECHCSMRRRSWVTPTGRSAMTGTGEGWQLGS